MLGYAGVDNKGLAGLELGLEHDLAGRPGKETIVRDPFGRTIDVVSSTPERPGRDVFLTLDHTLQAKVESVLRLTVAKWSAASGSAIVLDPSTGGILAMAVAPGFDANDFSQVPDSLQRNRAVTDTYEPGSTFKLVTYAAALSDKVVTPNDTFSLPPEIKVADRVITDAESRPTETMSVAEMLARSSNVGTVMLAQLLGPERLARWIARFGFGKPTGIDFPGESPGIVLPVERWSGSTIGNVPIGQGIAVTPIQTAAAYGALANKGVWIQPHLVDHVRGGRPPKLIRHRIVSARSPSSSSACSRGSSPPRAPASRRLSPGIRSPGRPGRLRSRTLRGLLGHEVRRLVRGDRPGERASAGHLRLDRRAAGEIFGGLVAAPAFRDIARFALQYLGVRPDDLASLRNAGSAPLG